MGGERGAAGGALRSHRQRLRTPTTASPRCCGSSATSRKPGAASAISCRPMRTSSIASPARSRSISPRPAISAASSTRRAALVGGDVQGAGYPHRDAARTAGRHPPDHGPLHATGARLPRPAGRAAGLLRRGRCGGGDAVGGRAQGGPACRDDRHLDVLGLHPCRRSGEPGADQHALCARRSRDDLHLRRCGHRRRGHPLVPRHARRERGGARRGGRPVGLRAARGGGGGDSAGSGGADRASLFHGRAEPDLGRQCARHRDRPDALAQQGASLPGDAGGRRLCARAQHRVRHRRQSASRRDADRGRRRGQVRALARHHRERHRAAGGASADAGEAAYGDALLAAQGIGLIGKGDLPVWTEKNLPNRYRDPRRPPARPIAGAIAPIASSTTRSAPISRHRRAPPPEIASMQRFSFLSLAVNALSGNKGWQAQWRSPEPQAGI